MSSVTFDLSCLVEVHKGFIPHSAYVRVCSSFISKGGLVEIRLTCVQQQSLQWAMQIFTHILYHSCKMQCIFKRFKWNKEHITRFIWTQYLFSSRR